MNLHLKEISEGLSPDAHAVIIMDQAPWHKSITVPPNITIIFLPPYSPELNPVEQVWDYLRSNYLSNRVYKTIDDVFDASCKAWNSFIAQLDVIFSIGMRSWIQQN
jgi:transposase